MRILTISISDAAIEPARGLRLLRRVCLTTAAMCGILALQPGAGKFRVQTAELQAASEGVLMNYNEIALKKGALPFRSLGTSRLNSPNLLRTFFGLVPLRLLSESERSDFS